jgi:hypothetical protein
MWLDPKYDTNSFYWPTLFCEEREEKLDRFDDEHPPPKKNMVKQIKFWPLRRPTSTPSTPTRKNRGC